MSKQTWIYDLEIFPNLFLAGFRDIDTDKIHKYEISERIDQRKELAEHLRKVDHLVGFNSRAFDEPLLMFFIKLYAKEVSTVNMVNMLKNKSTKLISEEKRWKNHVKKNRVWKDHDLFSIMHYDNKARMTSLKNLEFNLKMKNIQSLPYHHNKFLTHEEIENVCKYLDNDLEATYLFYEEVKSEIELRAKMTTKYGFDMSNMNAPKIGEQVIIRLVKDRVGLDLTKLPKIRDKTVKLDDIIFDYIKFNSVQFRGILDWFRTKTIKETKGVFTGIPVEELAGIEGYYHKKLVKGFQKDLNALFGRMKWVFGQGGIHACADAGVYEEDNEYEIIDVDVASYYPNLVKLNRLKPRHFPDIFCKVYGEIYDERKTYPKGTVENLGLKLALNGGGFGKGGDKYSCFYDPAYLLSITVNGQLLLCMLAEWLWEKIPGLQFIQANTDGITFRTKRVYRSKIEGICRAWEVLTKLDLEFANYKTMIIKDVNNYIALDVIGKSKRKGAAFMHKVSGKELDWHKNHSFLVIPKAVEAYFINGTDPKEFLEAHDNIYDFMGRAKVNRTSKLIGRNATRIRITDKGIIDREMYLKIRAKFGFYMIHDTIICNSDVNAELIKVLLGKGAKLETEDITLQNLTRYIPVKTGYKLIKVIPPLKGKTATREIGIDKDYEHLPINDLRGIDLVELKERINLDYYLNKINQIIEKIE